MASQQFAFRGFFGLGFENQAAYGTPVARTAFARFVDCDVQRRQGEDLTKTSRLPSPEDVSLGHYDVTFNGRVEMRPETIGALLRAHAGVGSVATTQPDAGGAPTVYRHVVTPKDVRQPVTGERRLGTLAKSEVIQGGVIEEVGFEFSQGVTMNPFRGVGQKDVINSSPSTPTFDAKAPLHKHQATVTMAGSVVGVKSARVMLGRHVEKGDFESGSRFRVDADVGEIMARAEFVLAFRDSSHLQRSLGAANATEAQNDPGYFPLNVKWEGATIAAAYKYAVDLDFARTWWQPVGVPMRGKDAIEQRIQMIALHDETAATPWKATLTNTQTAL